MADQSLSGRVAVVTGSESGIGNACAVALAEAGARVAAFYRDDKAAAQRVVDAIQRSGGCAVAVKVDVSEEAMIETGFQQACEALGTPDILVNAAGLNMSGIKVVDMELAQWRRMLETDLTGSFLTARWFVRHLSQSRRPAAIINITSIHSFAMRAGGADYDAAKGALRNLTRTLALEVAADGITVNAIAPGMILTPMNERAQNDASHREVMTKHIPLGRAGTAAEVADLVVFLASSKGAYVTGTEMVIDGGLSLVQATGA